MNPSAEFSDHWKYSAAPPWYVEKPNLGPSRAMPLSPDTQPLGMQHPSPPLLGSSLGGSPPTVPEQFDGNLPAPGGYNTTHYDATVPNQDFGLGGYSDLPAVLIGLQAHPHEPMEVDNQRPTTSGATTVREVHNEPVARTSTTYEAAPEMCAICKGRATGFHYEVAACDGCKTFFRRTLISGRRPVCKRNWTCNVDKGVVRRCKGCRFNKCIDTGMEIKAINFGDFAVDEKLCEYVVNRQRSNSDTTTSTLSITSQTPSPSPETEVANTVSRLDTISQMLAQLSIRTTVPEPQGTSLTEVLQLCPNRYLKFTTVNEMESQVGHTNCPFTEALRTVEFIKTFPFYADFDMRDRVTWIRDTSLCLAYVLQGYNAIKYRSDTMIDRHGRTPRSPPGMKVAQYNFLYKKIVSFFVDHNIHEDTEVMLLLAITACCRASSTLSQFATEHLSAEKERLAKCLFQYEMKTYGARDGVLRFQSLLSVVCSIIQLASQHQNLFLLNSSQSQRKRTSSKILDQILLDFEEPSH